MRRLSNYSDLLAEMPRYCCPLEMFYFGFLVFVETRMKYEFRQDNQAGKSIVKCLFKDTTECASRSQSWGSNHSTS